MPQTSLDIGLKLNVRAKERQADPKEVWGIPWGLECLDKLTGGIHKQRYTVLGALPGFGKTALLCQIAFNVAGYVRENYEGKCIRIISTEMSAERLIQRMALYADALEVQRRLKDDPTKVIKPLTQKQFDTGFVTEKEMQRYQRALDVVSELPIEIEDDPTSPKASRNWIAEDGRCVWFGLDYIQKHPTGTPGLMGEDVKGAIQNSHAFQNIAQKVCPGMALSSLNRKIYERPNHRPVLADFFGAAGIEHDADIGMFLHWPDFWENQKQNEDEKRKPRFMQLVVAKNRDGELDDIDVLFSPQNWSFKDFDREKL